MPRSYETDVYKWLVRKCNGQWFVWKPMRGVPDYVAASFADLIAGRRERLNWI